MKKIVPFNNILEFNTDVKEITAISLEPVINKQKDLISGVFHIDGEYKITEGSIEKESFKFELPFDIALSENYKEETLLVDVDDFRYDLISDKKLKVNIDLYIDGEIEETVEVPKQSVEIIEPLIIKDTTFNHKNDERLDLLEEMLEEKKENNMEEELTINNENININNNENENNINIINDNGEEKYVTYRVYKVLDNDNLDTILTKYNITKEMLNDYNDIENIKPGDKLIIPTNEK